jgi:nicotinate-nucleotide adenylyltransferase
VAERRPACRPATPTAWRCWNWPFGTRPARSWSTAEIERGTPTYTVDTLRELRAELGPDASIVFLMGADQLQQLDSWRDWRDCSRWPIRRAARPGYHGSTRRLPPAVAAELAPRRATPEQVRAQQGGPRVCLAHTLAVDISATEVRAALQRGESAKGRLSLRRKC